MSVRHPTCWLVVFIVCSRATVAERPVSTLFSYDRGEGAEGGAYSFLQFLNKLFYRRKSLQLFRSRRLLLMSYLFLVIILIYVSSSSSRRCSLFSFLFLFLSVVGCFCRISSSAYGFGLAMACPLRLWRFASSLLSFLCSFVAVLLSTWGESE